MNPEALVAWITVPVCVLGAIGAAVFGDAGIVLDVLAGGGLGAIIGQAIIAFGRSRGPEGRAAQVVGRWTAIGAGVALLINVFVEVL